MGRRLLTEAAAPELLPGLVLAGGQSSRLGQDKASVDVHGVALLDRVLGAVGPAVVVGPRRRTCREVRWVAESGGGPVAGIAAGLPLVRGPRVAVLACDLPFVTPALLASLAAHDADVVLAVAGGRDQYLLSVWGSSALRRALPTDPVGARVRDLLVGLSVVRVDVPEHEALDCDTPADLVRARQAG